MAGFSYWSRALPGISKVTVPPGNLIHWKKLQPKVSLRLILMKMFGSAWIHCEMSTSWKSFGRKATHHGKYGAKARVLAGPSHVRNGRHRSGGFLACSTIG